MRLSIRDQRLADGWRGGQEHKEQGQGNIQNTWAGKEAEKIKIFISGMPYNEGNWATDSIPRTQNVLQKLKKSIFPLKSMAVVKKTMLVVICQVISVLIYCKKCTYVVPGLAQLFPDSQSPLTFQAALFVIYTPADESEAQCLWLWSQRRYLKAARGWMRDFKKTLKRFEKWP